jgi:hypothetical protein
LLKPIAFELLKSIPVRANEPSFKNSIRNRINHLYFDGEFDPGSERTLAAWIRHASRAGLIYFNSSEEKFIMRAAHG